MQTNWNFFLKEQKNKQLLLFTLLALGLTLFAFLHFLTFNELRSGRVFNDPVLNLFPPVNVSIFTFLLTYSFCLFGLIVALRSPFLFIKLLQAYTIMTLLRMLCLYLVPLEPPVNIIPLQDVLLHSSFYSGRDNLKDLFFSGHTTTLFLFAFGLENKKLKITFVIVGCVVGMLLMLQHVHYSIDVAAAPVVAYVVLWLQGKMAGKRNRMV
ncbi:MAG: hypothetical protein JWP12_3960 [Bacteroidetes bacterium]|nr:hypothetical protein [Bacteroidota bacterium]